MWTLCCAEWTKTWKRPANWVLASIVLGIVFICFAALTLVGLNGPDGSGGTPPERLMMFPHGFQLPLLVLTALGSIIGITFMANSVGSEYSGDTWKALLPRRGNRTDFIISKVVCALLFMLALSAAALVLGQTLGMVGTALIGGELVSFESFALLPLVQSLTIVFLQIAVFAAITLLVTVVSRSTMLGVVFAFVCTMMFGMAVRYSAFAAFILPDAHMANLQAHWVFEEGTVKADLLAEVTRSFGGVQVPLFASALVIVGYIVGSIALAVWVFRRRDMAGQ
jgi:ABC-type transport system involved in multi-copper enzyme maturation permease subunit